MGESESTRAALDEPVVLPDGNVVVPSLNGTEVPENTSTVGLPSTANLGLPMTRETSIHSVRPADVYNSTIPVDKLFWLEITAKPDGFDRDAYEMDEEEFRVVGIFGEIGEGDDAMYEVQFEDDHTAIVPPYSPKIINGV